MANKEKVVWKIIKAVVPMVITVIDILVNKKGNRKLKYY